MKEVGKNYCDTSKLSVRKISKSVAKDIVIKNHYSHLWTKVSYAIGLYIEDDSHQFFNTSEKLIGVACYGDPIGRLSGQSITDMLDRTEVLELVRVFVFDGYGSNIESWFLGKTFEWLRENVPHIKALISYSDPKEGHNGTIYQATNWYIKVIHYDIMIVGVLSLVKMVSGNMGEQYFHIMEQTTQRKSKEQIDKPFWIRKEPRKHRYVYILSKGGERRKLLKTLKHPILPYPKSENEVELEIRKLEPIESRR